MKTEATSKDIMMAVGVGGACALLLAVVLASIARPSDLQARTATISDRIETASGLFRPARNSSTFGPDAVCAQAPEAQAEALRTSLTNYAGQGGIEVRGIDARPMDAGAGGAKLVPVRLKFEAIGSYEAIVLLLENLGRQRPEVFVDALDLTAKTSNVTLAFTGRVFCSA